MVHRAIKTYLEKTDPEKIDPGFLGYLTSLAEVASVSPKIAASIVNELIDQRRNLKLIASENYSSLATQLAMGNLLTDKYAEGFPGHRFYAGCDNVDFIESYACETACRLFGCEHAYVQPHSGADANLIAFRSEEHTSELQSRPHLVCRLLLEKKKINFTQSITHNTTI